MARTKPIRRSYGAGEWGRNRVRVFPDPKTGLFQIEWREDGRRLTRSLKHRDWARAKRQADKVAADFAVHQPGGKAEAGPEPLTLGRLFDIYGEEVTPTKGERTRRRDRVATVMFLRFFGRDRKPATLSQRDWDRFIRERRAGRVGLSGEPVGNRTIEWDLTFLIAVFNWAARSRDDQGRLLLDRNPLKGLRKPREKNPVRVVLNEEEYRALLRVSRQVDWRFHVALVLTHETGHRIGAIPQAPVVGHRPRGRSGAVACGAREDGLRTPDPGDGRGGCRLGRGTTDEHGDGRRSGAARSEGCLQMHGPRLGVPLVAQGADPRGAGAEAGAGLALPEAKVCDGSDGPAAQGPLRTRRLEERTHGAQVLSEGRRGTTQEGSGEPPEGSRLRSQTAGINWRESGLLNP